jgi:hypothetical protein
MDRAIVAMRAHVHTFVYGDDDNGHSGSFCACGMEEPVREPSGYADPDMPVPADAWGPPAPIYTGSKPGPWFSAAFPGICEECGHGFEQGDTVRADGQGGYECRDCVTDAEADAPEQSTPTWERPTAANVKMPEPVGLVVQSGEYAGAVVTVLPSMPPEHLATTEVEETIIKAQSEVLADFFTAPSSPVAAKQRTDRNGHRLKDPVIGDFRRYKNGNIKSVTRVTSFNKAVEDTSGLTDWQKVNVLVGAAARPEVAADAHGKTWDTHKDELKGLVKILEEAAGSKKAADTGTLIHKLCERWDKGEVTMDQVPPAFRPFVTLYRDALKDAGLRAVTGMQELTTFIEEWGGVSGSFDNVYEHVATGMFYIGDIKTGKTMDYGWDPIECQEAIYAHGYNRFGTYDWDAEEWVQPKLGVSEEWGIVIHLPTKGDHVGTCRVLAADLERGWDYAAECGSVRARRSLRPKPIPFTSVAPAQALPQPDLRSWEEHFSAVTDVPQAGALWQRAKDAGVEPLRLNALVQLAQSALRKLGVSS